MPLLLLIVPFLFSLFLLHLPFPCLRRTYVNSSGIYFKSRPLQFLQVSTYLPQSLPSLSQSLSLPLTLPLSQSNFYLDIASASSSYSSLFTSSSTSSSSFTILFFSWSSLLCLQLSPLPSQLVPHHHRLPPLPLSSFLSYPPIFFSLSSPDTIIIITASICLLLSSSHYPIISPATPHPSTSPPRHFLALSPQLLFHITPQSLHCLYLPPGSAGINKSIQFKLVTSNHTRLSKNHKLSKLITLNTKRHIHII